MLTVQLELNQISPFTFFHQISSEFLKNKKFQIQFFLDPKLLLFIKRQHKTFHSWLNSRNSTNIAYGKQKFITKFLFQSGNLLLCIIINQGPKRMFCYSYFNQSAMPAIMWTFIQPMQPPSVPEHQSQFQCCSNLLNGSNQETKDVFSPVPLNLGSLDCAMPTETDLKFKSKSDKNKKLKQKIEQEQFKPNAPQIKKGRRTPQNSNRNVIPNIMHQVVSFIQKRSKSEKILKKLLQKLDESDKKICSQKRFYLYQLLIKDKLNNYVNVESLSVLNQLQQPECSVYSEKEQRQYNKISRLLIQYFLTQVFDTLIITSTKVSSDKKQDHLMMKRKILQQITKVFQE